MPIKKSFNQVAPSPLTTLRHSTELFPTALGSLGLPTGRDRRLRRRGAGGANHAANTGLGRRGPRSFGLGIQTIVWTGKYGVV